MTRSVEDRARAQCTVDAEIAAVPPADIPAVVDRLWPVAAREMMGVIDGQTLQEPSDITRRIKEYQRLRPSPLSQRLRRFLPL